MVQDQVSFSKKRRGKHTDKNLGSGINHFRFICRGELKEGIKRSLKKSSEEGETPLV